MSAEFLELGTKPISPDAPSGVSARDETDFVALQNEIRKLELPDQPTVHWDGAVRNAAAVLGTRSKDLLAAAYLALALFERDGHPGLATGLTVMRDLIANFWDTLWPEAKRVRGRIAAFEWLAERGAASVRRRGPDGAAEAVKTSLERVEEIGNLLTDKVEGGGYLLSELRDALNELPTEASPPPAPAASAPATASFSAPAAASGAPSSIASESDFEQVMAETKRLMRLASDWLRTQQPASPLPYRLARFATWMTVKLPPADGGKTQIPAPQPPDLLDKLQQMAAAGQNAGVLEITEGRFPTAVFWLDLHRFAAQALERTGPDARAAADAVVDETATLLRRLPGLEALRFQNDQPVANAETREWIKTRVLAAPAGDGAAPAAPAAGGGEDAEAFAAVVAEARGLAQQKKLAEALRRLEEEASRAGNLRDRVRWKLEGARLCVEGGHGETALGILEGLDQAVRDASVEAWDPALCVEVLKLLLVVRGRVPSAGKTPDDAARGREQLGRLCRLDVVAALELNGRK